MVRRKDRTTIPMKPPTSTDITAALKAIEATELPDSHPRRLARQAIAEHRRVRAIDPDYDFSAAPQQMRQVIYDMSVKYGAQHSWWARLRRG